MTRGRKPLIALKEAYEIALKRGKVLLVSDGRYDHFHFILFTDDRVTFIKVKRTLTNTSDPKEILDNYGRDVRHLALVPQNAVDARELWARSPRGDFFFFRIEKDKILGLMRDGSVIKEAEYPLELLKPENAAGPPAKPEKPREKDPGVKQKTKKSGAKPKGKDRTPEPEAETSGPELTEKEFGPDPGRKGSVPESHPQTE